MTELYRHIGPNTDVPAGDLGVGGREVAYLFGQYKRLTNEWSGVLTGKGLSFGGSLARTEATGYGLAYFVDEYLKSRGDSFEGKNVVVHGSGNVAIYAVQKVSQLGGKVIAASDTHGWVEDPDGIDYTVLEHVYNKKRSGNDRGVSLAMYVDARPGRHVACRGRPRRVAAALRHRAALRSREHAAARGRPGARRQRLQGGRRGREHAHDHRGDQLPHRARRGVHAGQGGELRAASRPPAWR